MTCFSRFYKKEKLISKTLEIDENLYYELEKLSNFKYDASISKLVNASIENLLKTEKIDIYERKNQMKISRSFLIRESFLEGLYELKDNYTLSINLLVNIAVRNAICEEKADSKKEQRYILINNNEKDYQAKVRKSNEKLKEWKEFFEKDSKKYFS